MRSIGGMPAVALLLLAWLWAGDVRPARADARDTYDRYPFAPGRAHADDFVPHETAGPALSLGIGELYAGLGAELAYQLVPWRERGLSIAPHVAVGYSLGPRDFEGQLGVRGGALLAYGGAHRWLADVAFGALHTHGLRLHDLPAASRVVEGVSVAVGVERMNTFGLFVRALIGAYWLTARAVDDDTRLGILLAFGLGWKPW